MSRATLALVVVAFRLFLVVFVVRADFAGSSSHCDVRELVVNSKVSSRDHKLPQLVSATVLSFFSLENG